MEIKVTINNYGTINVYQNESKEIDKGKELCKTVTQSIKHCGHCTLGGNCSEHKCSMAVDLAVDIVKRCKILYTIRTYKRMEKRKRGKVIMLKEYVVIEVVKTMQQREKTLSALDKKMVFVKRHKLFVRVKLGTYTHSTK